MQDFNQIPETKRFLEVLDELLDKQMVNSDAEFCRAMDYSVQSFSQIRKQKRNVTVELISKLYTTFGGNPVYVLAGEGRKLLSGGINAEEPSLFYGHNQKTEEVVKQLLAQNETLRRIVDLHADNVKISAKYVASLEQQIEKLKKENANKETGK